MSTTALLCNARFTPPARHDKTVLSASCLVCRCELDDCSERVQTSDFLSATYFICRPGVSGIQFTPPKQTQQLQTRQFCRVWRGGVDQL